MGTFVGHLIPGFTLVLLGLWHTFNTIKAYSLKGQTKFTSKFWYPLSLPLFKFKHLELIFIFSFSILAATLQILEFPPIQFSFKSVDLEHMTLFLYLALYSGFTLAIELTHSPEVFSGLVGILASSVFGQELFLLHFHSADHAGLEGHYHFLLQLIVALSFISALAMTSFSNSFTAALLLSVSVVFQGCWFMNMAFMLWFPRFVPNGCTVKWLETGSYMHGAVICASDEANRRAAALSNLQFSWILAGILFLTACLCLKFIRKHSYEQVYSRVLDVGQILMDVDVSRQVHLPKDSVVSFNVNLKAPDNRLGD